MTSLTSRIAGADVGSRELDAEIVFDLFAKPLGKHKLDGGPTGYIWPEKDPSWNLGLRFPGKDRAWFKPKRDGETLVIERDGALVLMNALRVAPLTSSLDAIVALIEQRGFAWRVESPLPSRNGDAWATAGAPGAQEDAFAKTPALALCAAFLTALESQPHAE